MLVWLKYAMIKFKKISKKIFYGKYKTGKGYKRYAGASGGEPREGGSPKNAREGKPNL